MDWQPHQSDRTTLKNSLGKLRTKVTSVLVHRIELTRTRRLAPVGIAMGITGPGHYFIGAHRRCLQPRSNAPQTDPNNTQEARQLSTPFRRYLRLYQIATRYPCALLGRSLALSPSFVASSVAL